MAKFTYKEIKEIINITPKAWAGKQISEINQDKGGAAYVGYYRKANTNWVYEIDSILHDNCIRLVVSIHGGYILAK